MLPDLRNQPRFMTFRTIATMNKAFPPELWCIRFARPGGKLLFANSLAR